MKKQKTGWKLLLVLTMLVMCVGCGAKKNTSGSVSMYDPVSYTHLRAHET